MQDSHSPHSDGAGCAAYRPLLDDVVAEEVDAVTVARVEAHLSRCADCRRALASARAYRRAMRRVGVAERASDALRGRAVQIAHDTRDLRGGQ